MNKEFIPYEQALELKELGFDEPCFGWFTNSCLRIGSVVENKHVQGEDETLAPLYQQAFKFFREKHSIFPNVSYEGKFMNTFEILNEKGDDYNSGERFSYHDTYEEAELACLKKLIEITKTK